MTCPKKALTIVDRAGRREAGNKPLAIIDKTLAD
jgi:hypothetical protein